MLDYPFDPNLILKKKKALKRQLLENKELVALRIAILGGSTTAEIKDILELFLLKEGISPSFYESEYNRYYEDSMFDNPVLKEFAPQIIYIHTTNVNIMSYAEISDDDKEINRKVAAEFERYKSVWQKLKDTYNCPVIQNNFDLPHTRILGNLDCSDIHGKSSYLSRLNLKFSEQARSVKDLYINDLNYLSAWFGLSKWHDKTFWYSYKYAFNYEAIPLVSYNLSRIICSIFGKSKKCLVLDLDNTLWGGVVGDDGVDKLKIGKEDAIAEAFTGFQQYLKELKNRGIMLAVSSKNDPQAAMEGLSHPDNILSFEDFLVFKANWEPKHLNIADIAKELNISLDSLVFIDDNPAERELVRSQLPQVAVPDIGDDIVRYAEIIDKAGYFEPVSLSADDVNRNKNYSDNSKRTESQAKFDNYGDFLLSLEMKAEISDFKPVYLERITQLTNKTNQFNLTTKRYSMSEIESISKDDSYIRMFGRLTDKYGDNGLISVITGKIERDVLDIELWIMSCRVVKREMELAMFDRLVETAVKKGLKKITGRYCPTAKNAMVAEHYSFLGFKKTLTDKNGVTCWEFEIPKKYENKNKYIEVNNG